MGLAIIAQYVVLVYVSYDCRASALLWKLSTLITIGLPSGDMGNWTNLPPPTTSERHTDAYHNRYRNERL